MSEFANPVKLRIFSRQIPVNQKSLPVSIGIRCILVIGVFADPFLNRFAFQMSEFANPVKLQIFSCQIPVNQKSLPGIDIWMSQCKFFLVLPNDWNFPKLINNNLGDVQKAGISSDMRPAFAMSSSRNELGMFSK